jgi:hypothetical protein
MSKIRWFAASLLVLAAACGGNKADEFAEATPDVQAMQLEITGDAAEGAVRDDGSDAPQALVALSNPPEYLAKTRAAIKDLNDYVKKVLTPIALLAQQAGSAEVGATKVFGPKDQGNANWKLSVKKIADKTFRFKLEARALGSTDDAAFKAVAVGELARGAEQAHRGKGVLGLDLSAYATVDTTSHAAGKLLASFAHAGLGKVVVYRLAAFTPDSTARAAVSAVIYGHQTASGEAVVRAATLSDVITTTSAKELMFSHLHWMPGVGGRADLLLPNKGVGGTAPNGDLPSNKWAAAKSCWNATEQEGYKAFGLCTVGQGIAGCTFEVAGATTACTASGRDPADTDNPSDVTTEPGAPATPPSDPPATMPAFP